MARDSRAHLPPALRPSAAPLQFQGSHGALGDRARKLKSEGILIIRFEMPFNVWCAGCNHLIGKVRRRVPSQLAGRCLRRSPPQPYRTAAAGARKLQLPTASLPAPPAAPTQGVRFNAEKKQAGAYHSTKIWSFRMRAPCCQQAIEIHTDPKAAEYVIVSGARRCGRGGRGGSRLLSCWAGGGVGD